MKIKIEKLVSYYRNLQPFYIVRKTKKQKGDFFVNITTLQGNAFEVSCEPSVTIEEIQKKIQELSGIPLL